MSYENCFFSSSSSDFRVFRGVSYVQIEQWHGRMSGIQVLPALCHAPVLRMVVDAANVRGRVTDAGREDGQR